MKIVTSIYELNYVKERGGQIYKQFPLLTHTIKNIIFSGYEYVIYTDKKTLEKYNLSQVFNFPNVKIKIEELNSEFYIKNINPIREKVFSSHDLYDRIYTVENYMEVIFNKFKFLLNELNDQDNVVWIDAGLFGTSCHDSWRDDMVKLCHSELFLEKINETINNHSFFCLKGNDIQINYELNNKINELFGTKIKITPGGLFGGKSNKIKQVLANYENLLNLFIKTYNDIISEQEILCLLTYNKNIKYFEFNDWLDFQKGILNMMGLLDSNYKTNKFTN
jgi:hypothetical protein